MSNHLSTADYPFSTPPFHFIDDAAAENLPPPQWLIDSVVPTRSLCLLYGSPGAGKTFVALDWAFAVASGTAWQGRAVRPGPAIYVLAEGSAGLPRRVRAWKRSRGVKGTVGVEFLCDPLDMMR